MAAQSLHAVQGQLQASLADSLLAGLLPGGAGEVCKQSSS